MLFCMQGSESYPANEVLPYIEPQAQQRAEGAQAAAPADISPAEDKSGETLLEALIHNKPALDGGTTNKQRTQ